MALWKWETQTIVHKSHFTKCRRDANFVSYCYEGICNPSYSALWLYAFKVYAADLTLNAIFIFKIFVSHELKALFTGSYLDF